MKLAMLHVVTRQLSPLFLHNGLSHIGQLRGYSLKHNTDIPP